MQNRIEKLFGAQRDGQTHSRFHASDSAQNRPRIAPESKAESLTVTAPIVPSVVSCLGCVWILRNHARWLGSAERVDGDQRGPTFSPVVPIRLRDCLDPNSCSVGTGTLIANTTADHPLPQHIAQSHPEPDPEPDPIDTAKGEPLTGYLALMHANL